MKYLANQIEFDDMFNTEQDCIDYLSLLGGQTVLNALNVDQLDIGIKTKEEISVSIAQEKRL